MNILICGADGYLGWTLSMDLAAAGHRVVGIDNGLRRRLVSDVNSTSAIPIASYKTRQEAFHQVLGAEHRFIDGDIRRPGLLASLLETEQIDAVVNLAQMPSAPWSMASLTNCLETHRNNVEASLHLFWALKDKPDVHLITLGTMGEYGTPNVPIPEGYFLFNNQVLPFPRQPGSHYHAAKCHVSTTAEMCARIWGLRITDIMQGVVYGTLPEYMPQDERMQTRLDCDEAFGTAINRFCAEALLGIPLTVYGVGEQKRGFLPIEDSMQCIRLLLNNPPERATHRVINQYDEVYSVKELAKVVAEEAELLRGDSVEIAHVDNPRVEKEQHTYETSHATLDGLGYKPVGDLRQVLRRTLKAMSVPTALRQLEKVAPTIQPKTLWR